MTLTWLLLLALASPAAALDDKPKRTDAQKEAQKAQEHAQKDARKQAKEAAEEAAEEAENRAEDTDEFRDKLAKRIEKGVERRQKETAEALKDYADRIKDYLKIHKKAADTLPPLTGNEDPATVAAYRVSLARAIRARRPYARRGAIFDAKVVPTIVARVRTELEGPEARPARKVLREGNPRFDVEGAVPVTVRVNADYPLRAPVSTVPPSILLTLPQLPDSLEYRFVGRDLILRDVEANIIVDFIVGAAPPQPTR
jgi:hypothetical protein